MTGPGSLRGRLAIVAVCATAIWVCALTVILNLVLGSQLRGQADGLLRTRATAVAATVVLDPGGHVTVREPPNDSALDSNIWVYQGGTRLQGPRATASVQLAVDRLLDTGTRYADVGGRARVRLYSLPITRAGRQIGTIVTATSLDPYHRTARSALLATTALALLFVGGVYLVTRRVVDRALRPVAEMAEQAAQWSAHDVTHRFGDAARPAELRELAARLDSVLNRIGAVLRHEQQLAAELSHELKTPLSVIVAENDLLAAHASTDVSRSHGHQVIADTADRMNQLLDTLLADAATRITETPGLCYVEPVIGAVLADAVGAGDTSITTTVDVTAGLEVGVSKEIVQRILTPLLSNARRYAASRIEVRAHVLADAVEIVVADDGPGVPATLRSVVFDPGTRGNPADGHPGPGLGLALARRLARSCGGDITLRNDERGAAFSVVLPAG